MKVKNLKIILLYLFFFLFCQDLYLYAKTVTDQLQRKVCLPDSPERVISLAPNVTEIIFALKQEKKLVGATMFSDHPKEAKKIYRVGSYVNLDIEKIIALNPDLCIATKDGNPKIVIDKLEKLKIPVYAVDPRNLKTVMNTISQIAFLLNANKKADKIISDMQKRISAVTNLVQKREKKPKVFFQIDTDMIISVGTNTFIHELITKAGGINLGAGNIDYPRFNMEHILKMNPDIMIITSMEKNNAFEKAKNRWEKYKSIAAVKNNKIFLANSDLLNRPSPRLVDGLELLFKILHKESVNGL